MKKSVLFLASLGLSLLSPSSFNMNVADEAAYASVLEPDVADLVDLCADLQGEPFLKDWYVTEYFSNLRSNYPYNTHGTCSYTALAMFLSYYDTYWDDSIIPEQYEQRATFDPSNDGNADFDLVPFGTESPGLRSEDFDEVSEMTQSEYAQFVEDTGNMYFQSRLMNIADDYLGSVDFDENSSFGMTYQELFGLARHYVYTYTNLDPEFTSIWGFGGGRPSNRIAVIGQLEEGNPVLIRCSSPDLGTHAMVAYDYDRDTDQIYVHTGWKNEAGQAITHMSLEDLGFNVILDGIAMSVFSEHTHSYHYVSESGQSCCACSLAHPRNIQIHGGDYRDIPPSFSWESLKDERWFESYNPRFKFDILNQFGVIIFTRILSSSYSYTMTDSEWLETWSSSRRRGSFSIGVSLYSAEYPWWDDRYCITEFDVPDECLETPSFSTDEYLFGSGYPTDQTTASDFVEHTTRQGFTFETRRFRVGYNNTSLVMSASRRGYDEAWIEYRFKTAIRRLDVELSYYMPPEIEGFGPDAGTAVIQKYWGSEYQDVFDIFASENNLPEWEISKRRYVICFEESVHIVRFRISSNFFSFSTRDGSRLCIGDMTFYPDYDAMPISGYELPYAPDEWSDVQESTNCYMYALNAKHNPNRSERMMNPGQSDGTTPSYIEYMNPPLFINLIQSDSDYYGFGLLPSSRMAMCSPGKYKVALFLDDYRDGYDDTFTGYHWYRQNDDGTWSHKYSTNPVSNKDSGGQSLIVDPELCNRDYGWGAYYNLPAYYFEVEPLSNIFEWVN